MLSRALVYGLAVPLAGAALVGSQSSPASAAALNVTCQASVVQVTSLAGLTTAPYVAGSDSGACTPQTAGSATPVTVGLGSLAGGLGGTLTLGANQAQTTVDNAAAAATTTVGSVSIPTPAGTITIPTTATAQAAVRCVAGVAQQTTSSTLDALQIGSNTITLPSPGAQETIPLTVLGQPVGSVTVNGRSTSGNSNTVQLLNVNLPGQGDIVVGQADVATPDTQACQNVTAPSTGDPGQGPPSTTTTTTTTTNGSSSTSSGCPAGTTLIPGSNMCGILGVSSNSTIYVSAPNSTPVTGATIISLAAARRRFHSPCLSGPGPQWVAIGTNGANRMTVRRSARVLALGGNDRVTVIGGTRSCVDGGSGADTLRNRTRSRVAFYGGPGANVLQVASGPSFLSGGSGNDLIIAGNGRDTIIGGAGNDRIIVGNGNDTINAGAGNDRISAGLGVDHINAGSGHNIIVARGSRVYVRAGRGVTVAHLRTANLHYARTHGVTHAVKL